jgi:hypothetical protein
LIAERTNLLRSTMIRAGFRRMTRDPASRDRADYLLVRITSGLEALVVLAKLVPIGVHPWRRSLLTTDAA